MEITPSQNETHAKQKKGAQKYLSCSQNLRRGNLDRGVFPSGNAYCRSGKLNGFTLVNPEASIAAARDARTNVQLHAL